MTKTVALLLGVHAHQPVGNFESVLDDAHLRCYGPFLRVLHQYPDFHFAIHFSGWLLEYLMQHYADDMALLKEMVARGQAEICGAGFTEPVLAAIPVRDRIGQIDQLSDYVQREFGLKPQGAWLTERVWESSVVPALADTGIRYVMVDDYHFLCTGLQSQRLNGYFSTEEDGRRVDLYPISEALRYRVPFAPAHEVVGFLENLADDSGQAAAVYFDDIEKFGIWPETYEWVYERGWLRDFIEGVLASDIVKPMRYCDYHAVAKSRGVVYLPTASYIEMNEWSLPGEAARHYADLVAQEKHNHRYDVTKPYIRGGIWRNFFMRYPESNWMHKRMLALSARYHALPEGGKTPDMLRALYEAQANDAYWHGMFGGLYLPHLRRAVYNALLRLEARLDALAPRPAVAVNDIDMDGSDEAFLQNGVLQAVIRLDGSASVCEFDAYRLAHNFGDTLKRQPEHYHHKVEAEPESEIGHDGTGIANPHEKVSCKHEIADADLVVDVYPKTLLRDFWLDGDGIQPLSAYRHAGTDGAELHFRADLQQGRIDKTIALQDNRLLVRYAFDDMPQGEFRVEINLAMPSCDGPAGRFRCDGEILGGFGQALSCGSFRQLTLEDEVLGGVLQLSSSVGCTFSSRPHFSVSQSEAGFEKVMQAVTLELQWPASMVCAGLELSLEAIRSEA